MRPFICVGVLGLLGILLSMPAAALTGDDLLKQCSAEPNSVERKQCESYIEGVVSGINTLTISERLLHPGIDSYPQLFCVPRFTGTKDLVAATVNYLEHHADTRHYDASSEILLALQQACPCKSS